MHQHKSLKGFKITDTDKGEFEAVFAKLKQKDHDGDVTMPGAFENGAEVRVSAYNHKSWDGALPVGKGVISEDGDLVVIKGKFFMDTEAGRDTFTVVKEMGGLQEWSYGYDTLVEERGTFEGEPANIIKKQKVHEVSPVILGAGLETETLAVKSRNLSPQMKQLYSEIYWTLRDLGRERYNAGNGLYVRIQDFDVDEDFVVYCIHREGEDAKYTKVMYTRSEDGGIELADAEEEVEATTEYIPARKNDDKEPESKAEDEGDTKDKEPESLTEEQMAKEVKARQVDLDAKTKGADDPDQQKQLYSDVVGQLDEAGSDRYGAGDGTFVHVRDLDIDDDWVIFNIWDRNKGTDTYMKVSFTRGDDNVELAAEDEEVEMEISYVAAEEESETETKDDKEVEEHGEKKAIPAKSTPTSKKAWDGPLTVAAIPNDAGKAVFRKMFAWVDPDGDPDKKSSYKFIHHEWDAENGKPGPANLKACTAGIGILNGGRGGTTIPQEDRKGVYNHLARHLKDGDREPPELKEASDVPGMKFSEHIEAVMTDVDELSERAASVVTLRAEKGKKRLGDESTTLLKELTTRLESLKGFLEQCSNNNDELSDLDRAFLDEVAREID